MTICRKPVDVIRLQAKIKGRCENHPKSYFVMVVVGKIG